MNEIKTEHIIPPSDTIRLFTFLKESDSIFQPKLSERVNIKQYSEKLAERAELFYVLDGGKDIANCAVYMNRDDICFISSFAVAQNMQRNGIGTRLMRAVISEGIKRNKSSIELDVYACNQAGIRFYLSQGFQKKAEKEKWLRMSLDLK